MRHLYLLTLFFSIFNVSAQLNISSSHSGSSYTYEKDRVLFVAGDIDLEKNHDPKIEPKIYLKKEGQLIQGEKDFNQTFGNGYISMFLEGTVNAQSSQFRRRVNTIPEIRLNIEFNGLYTRELILAFREGASTGADHAMDAKSFGALASDAAWVIEDQRYLIKVQPFVKEQKIPIIISIERESRIKISLKSLEDFSAEGIFLFDAKENSYQDLKSSDFKIKLPAENYIDRFYLSFIGKNEKPESGEKNLLDEVLPREEILISYDKKLQQVEVLANDLLNQIELYDHTEDLILTKRIYENQQYYYFYTGNLKEALYIVKVKTRGNVHYSKKLLLKK